MHGLTLTHPARAARGTDGIAPNPTGADPRLGRRWGPFELLRVLGRGGMGTVYEAHDRLLDRRVAIKLLSPRLAGRDDKEVERLLREARAVARLDHPNVVAVYQVGRHDGTYYIAMQLVRGRSASALVENTGPLAPAEAAGVVLEAARGLAAAHELGLVHRDVKPDNILVGDDGAVKVVDFGLAREQRPAVSGASCPDGVVGTPHFMSPEQAQGFPVDARGDLYSLGATWYCLLAGRPPFAGESAFEIMLQHISADPPDLARLRPDVPAVHLRLIRRALAKKPADRFQSAADLVAELERLAAEEEALLARRGRRLKRGIGAAVLLFTGLVGAGVARHFWMQPAAAADSTIIVQAAGERAPDTAAVPPEATVEALGEPQIVDQAEQGPKSLSTPHEVVPAAPEVPRGAGARLVVRDRPEPVVPVVVGVERREDRERPGHVGGRGGHWRHPSNGGRNGHTGHGHR
jgi:hypothetical protein